MHSVIEAWGRCAPATRLSIVAAICAVANPWLGLVVGLAAAWLYTRSHHLDFARHLAVWYYTPVLVAVVFVGHGESLPSDDLMRHLSAWQLGFDYRAQYPWSDIPKANLWLGFDFTLGMLQKAGLSKPFLLQWVPALSLVLQSVVLFGVLNRMLPARRRHAELFLLAGALGLLTLTPRSLLGRPEMFLLIFGMSAWLCRTREQAALWFAGFVALIPFYWLGWVYAPFALLLAPTSLGLVARFVLATLLGLLHLGFWQVYTGDYLGLLLWLKGTLSVPAGENAPLMATLSFWFAWVLLGTLGLALSTLNKRRFLAALPVMLLLTWFALPNQLRYLAAVSFIALPWMYRTFAMWARARQTSIPATAVVLGLAVATALAVFKTEPVPQFALDQHARVYSESPYAAVFYGQPGIAVEPSFALGATRPEWRGLKQGDALRCDLLQRAGFTHVIEKSLSQPLECADLKSIQGPWRLWTIKKTERATTH
ncbi:hypothetical protein WL29_21420 [Burkholderia ubonensis]|uniref:Glycosyltransferase RgtA/B/C/D-like domain-containing protein n=1 Tax=Burkholderia ubonensis TaxID=101571 RepID=A0A106QBH4_9BURK|nr:hypothetical protein [Burkholderia ubonensis]KWA83929.1 hypothetical protein WL29_21420 [Burkholderia ubonensis]